MEFNYQLSRDGYIILEAGSARFLLDTGNPISFGQGLSAIPGTVSTPDESVGGLTTQWLSEKLHCHIDGVVGSETLRNVTLQVDPINQKATFSDQLISKGESVEIGDIGNVPLLSAEIAGVSIPSIFDTGAPLAYAPSFVFEGRTPIASEQDFYPLYGYFQTDVYELPVRLGAVEETIRLGKLPEGIQQIHEANGFPAIVGLGFLKNRKIAIGHRERLISFESVEAEQ